MIPVNQSGGGPVRTGPVLQKNRVVVQFRPVQTGLVESLGEPVFEHDFPPRTDMMKEIREGPLAQQRFELELSSRLRGIVFGGGS